MADAKTSALMFQGTGSDVGKSLVVAALCRAYTKRGLKVRPFKPQNMSNNAAVTEDGGEIGRAQALQARACLAKPSVHMNPVLLKPQSDVGSQVVVQGRVRGTAKARDYQKMKPDLLPHVMDSFARIRAEADLVLIEGAGSAAEINLREGDIANMGFAQAAKVPVILVADIDRGGVLAQIVGTQMLLDLADRARLSGYIVNKFRGDMDLFAPALDLLTERTNLVSYGVLPWQDAARCLPAEDAMALEKPNAQMRKQITVAAPRLPRIANFDDLDPLRAEADVRVDIVPPGRALPGDAQLIVLPGSKATRADLETLYAEGWDTDIHAHLRRGGMVIGLCAGYQMLGRVVRDPNGIEGASGETLGLGFLDVETVLSETKILRETQGRDCHTQAPVRGYEMHMGETTGPGLAHPALELMGGNDGARSSDGRVMGTYLHGLFASDSFRAALLAPWRNGRISETAYEAGVETALDQMAAAAEEHLDLDGLLEIARKAANA